MSSRWGIRADLSSAFGFDSIAAIQNRNDFIAAIPAAAAASKGFFPLNSAYFSSAGGRSACEGL